MLVALSITLALLVAAWRRASRRFQRELRAFIALPQADYEHITAQLWAGRED